MSRDFGLIAKNITEVRESPLLWFPGVDGYFYVQVDRSDALASPTMALYENGIDVSATKLSGSMSITGRVIKTKVLGSLVGGSVYIAYIYFTDGGIGTTREITIIVPRLGENPSKYQFAADPYRIAESPILIYPGQTSSAVLSVSGEGTLASPTMYVYKGLTDDSATVLSGSASVSGRGITLKTIANLAGGSDYMGYVYFTDGGKSTIRYFEILCPKLGAY